MIRALQAIAAGAAAVLAFTVASRDPTDAISIGIVIVAASVAAGAIAALALLFITTRGRRTARARDAATIRALRRGAVVGTVFGLLALMRLIDGLTPVTAAFVVLAFAVTEYVLSTRPA